MSVNDPIADFLTRIRNAKRSRHRYVDIPLSKMKQRIAEILKEEGFLENFLVNAEKKVLRLFLKYNAKRNAVIQGLSRVSKPGLRRYAGSKEIPRVQNGMGISVVSTPKGILEGKSAKEQGVGGEILCCIW